MTYELDKIAILSLLENFNTVHKNLCDKIINGDELEKINTLNIIDYLLDCLKVYMKHRTGSIQMGLRIAQESQHGGDVSHVYTDGDASRHPIFSMPSKRRQRKKAEIEQTLRFLFEEGSSGFNGAH